MKSAGDEHGEACYVQHPVGLRTPHLLIGLWKGLISRVVLVSACCATTPRPEIHAKAHVSLNTQAGPKPTSLSTHKYAQSPRLTQHTSRPKVHVSLNSHAGSKPTSLSSHRQPKSPRLTRSTRRQAQSPRLSRSAQSPRLYQLTAQKPTTQSTRREAKSPRLSQLTNRHKAHVYKSGM